MCDTAVMPTVPTETHQILFVIITAICEMSLFGLGGFSDITRIQNEISRSLAGGSVQPCADYFQRSKEPITTATSVLGLKFNGGVMVAADMLGSYGNLARFRDCPRILKINDNIILGAGGDYADFQYLQEIIMQKVIDDSCIDDGFSMKPKALYNWLTRVLYTRRTKLDPLWNNYIVGGIQDGSPFLGTVDKLGTAFEDDQIATGFGSYLATPLMREAVAKYKDKGGLTLKKATEIMHQCLEILYYRDARSWPKYQIGIITPDEVIIDGPHVIEGNWDMAAMIQGY